ncbi:MAG TPA: hypothetical protein VNL15_08290 [Dehalococcoidia bacterium]|nr:hypothetical protein [Dehalococcoidia bacterium]
MCDFHEHSNSVQHLQSGSPDTYGAAGTPVVQIEDLLSYARYLAEQEEIRNSQVGFIGYGATKPGDRVLVAADTHYDPQIIEAIARALRDKGAKVDVIVDDAGTDRQFDILDEIRVVIRREPWERNPRRWEGIPWIEEVALRHKYDLLVTGKGGPTPITDYRYEQFPWLTKEHFAAPSTVFPRELHTLINLKTWGLIWREGRGGTVHLTDPEGTDITWTMWDEYYDGSRRYFEETGLWGHLHGHPPPPIVEKDTGTGVVAGTTSHFSTPFPQIKVHVENGRVEKIEGGTGYGQAWREVMEEGKDIHYPCFPRPGLFWLWETAIGTNPKVARPTNIHMLSSGGFEWERRRSGVIHMGFGTRWRGPEEVWAGERGLVYGHLHIHLLFPTYEITNKQGKKFKVIDHGRLTALDDPEVRKLAAKFGDPDELLKEDWIPQIPGISAPGNYEEYARDPVPYIYPSA